MIDHTEFLEDPDRILGPGGAYIRGESSLPQGAVWIPCAPGTRSINRRRLIAMGAGLAGLICLCLQPLAHWLGWSLLALGLALGWSARHQHRSIRGAPSGPGLHGMLLLDDHLIYRVGKDCAMVLRRDILGIERRKRPGTGVAGAFILAGRTGRGALLCPQPGSTHLARLQAWWAQSPDPNRSADLSHDAPTDRPTAPPA